MEYNQNETITREITNHDIEDFKSTIDGKSLYPEPENPEENKFVYSDYGNLVPLSYYAKMHKVSPDTVRQKILRGKQNVVRIGRNWCIDKDEPYVDTRIRSGKYKKQPDAERGYSEHYPMFCELIASNGYRILTTEKLSQYIAITEIKEFPSKLVQVTYLDSDGQIVAEGTGSREWFPRIGYVDESEYKKEKAD